MENLTAKHFVIQLGSLVSLYLSLSFLLALIFGIVNLSFPDAADGIWQIESSSSQVRLGIAMTIVFFPTYLLLTRSVNTARRSDPSGNYLGLTKWLIYLSLLIGGAALLIDLVVVINTFLEGEITQRFILKALAVLVVVGAAFYYYLLDARGHWLKHERESIFLGLATGLVVLIAIIVGFFTIQTPAETREVKLDEAQVSDLQNIQWQIQDYLALNNSLPQDLEQLVSIKIPEASEGRSPYRYEITDSGFKLCATFSAASKDTSVYYGQTIATPSNDVSVIINPDNWQHGEGEWCFERKVSVKQ